MPSLRVSSTISSRMSAWIVTSRPVVGSSSRSSFGWQASASASWIALHGAAGQLVRVLAHPSPRLGNPDPVEQLLGEGGGLALAQAAVQPADVGQLRADREDRVERAARVLEDHRDLRAAYRPERRLVELGEVRSLEVDRAGCAAEACGRQPEHRQRRERLAAAGLTDDRGDGATSQGERDVVEHRHGAAVAGRNSPLSPVIARIASAGARDVVTAAGWVMPEVLIVNSASLSSSSDRPSPMRWNAAASRKMPTPGKNEIHQLPVDDAGLPAGDHRAPLGRARLDAEAEEAERADGGDRPRRR